MKKNIYLSLVIILGAIIIAAVVVHSRNNSVQISVNKPPEKIKVDSKDWPLYKNEKLGIAFKHPSQINGSEMVFFQAGNILFVTTATTSLYIHREELPLGNDDAILKKAEEIEKKYPPGFSYGSWKIWIGDAHTDRDLEGMIQKWFGDKHNFGDGCKLGEKFPTSQAGVYDVGVATVRGNQNDADSSCWINWMAAFKYSSQYQRAAVWDIGQEPQFPVCNEVYDCNADIPMAESFSFIERK